MLETLSQLTEFSHPTPLERHASPPLANFERLEIRREIFRKEFECSEFAKRNMAYSLNKFQESEIKLNALAKTALEQV